jgi:purine-binding chemotaxis protein CheW
MSTTRPQQDIFRFIGFRLGDQTFAVDATAVVSAHETGVLSSAGTFLYEQHELQVVKVADWLGIDDRGHDGRGHFIIIQGEQGRLALQIRGISRTLKMSVDNKRPLPPPLDRLVKDRFSAILKWSAVVHEQGDKEIVWDARREEKQEELFLLLNHRSLLKASEQGNSESVEESESDAAIEPALATSPASLGQVTPGLSSPNQRLFLFSPALKSQGERPYKFGISAAQVMEVSRPLPIVPVPGAAGHIVGIVNWREEIVPVLRMAEMVGLEGIGSANTQRLLIALAPNGRDLMAVQVLADIRSQQLPIVPVPEPLDNAVASRYLHGSYALEQETLVMPNLKSMLQLV